MEGQSHEEDDEEMVGVPEDFKVGTSYELQRGGDHEEQHHCDHMTSHARGRRKADSDGILHVHVNTHTYISLTIGYLKTE